MATMQGNDATLLYVIVGTVIFVPPAVIAFRNTRFCPVLRILFSVTVVPLFAALMAANYFFVADYLPALIDRFHSLTEGNESTTSEVIFAFALTCPLAVAGCFLWYYLFKYVDRYCAGD